MYFEQSKSLLAPEQYFEGENPRGDVCPMLTRDKAIL